MREIVIEKAILHILDTNTGTPVLSEHELMPEESTDYLKKHIEKLLDDSELKECIFEDNTNPVRDLVSGMDQTDFISQTQQMAQILYHIMGSHVDIPSADVLFTVFREESDRFLGILKLNYKEAYTHGLANHNGTTSVNMIKYKTLFPNESQKIEECVFINLKNLTVKIKEKKYELDGQKDYYLSSYFMKTQSARSYKEQYRMVEKSAEQIVKKFYTGDSLKQAEVKMAIKNNVDENMEIDIDELSKSAFSDSREMQTQYKQELAQKGLTEKKIKINQQIFNDLEKSHKLITDIGIKMEIPTNLMSNRDKLEFFVNQDGTMSILIKNVNEVVSK